MTARLALFAILAACAGRPASGRYDDVEPGLGPENTVPASALPLAQCDDVTTVLTLDDVAAGKGDGQRIAIDLIPRAEHICTRLACASECCNSCDGDYFARLDREPADRDLMLHLTGAQLAGCGGMDCNYHCEPFGREPTTMYRFIGKNTFKPAGAAALYHRAVLEVEKFCTLGSGN